MKVAITVVFAVLLMGCSAATPPKTASTPEITITRNLAHNATRSLDVLSPPLTEVRPVIVTLHGCCGDRQDMFPFAHALAAAGAVVFNASWRNIPAGGGYPESYVDVACAVAFAKENAARFGGDPSRITVAGWSDGAMIASAVALSGSELTSDCASGSGSFPQVDALVGLGGFYGWPTDGEAVPSRHVNEDTVAFFQGRPEHIPDAWLAGNPYALLHNAPNLQVVLVVGDQDNLRVDAHCFYWAAKRAGLATSLVPVFGAGHQAVVSPRIPAGQRAAAATLAAAMNEPFGHTADVIPSCEEVQN